jgi:hypothetical protein
MNTLRILASLALLVISSNALATRDNPASSPGIQQWSGTSVVPADFREVNLSLTLDPRTWRLNAESEFTFETSQDGMPYFDLVPRIQTLEVDRERLDAGSLQTVSDPARSSQYVILKSVLPAGEHRARVTYSLPWHQFCGLSQRQEGASLDCLFFMYDLTERTFFEQYAPSNFEYDRYKMRVTINLPAGMVEHRVMSNADVTESSGSSFTLTFPEYFNTSSFFLHIIPIKDYYVHTSTVGGYNYKVAVYSRNPQLVSHAVNATHQALGEMSARFGTSGHKRFTVLLDPTFPGGMEFAGAAVTASFAVGHEIAHSWFARGVMPANGNAGWIDEGIATWRDNGYPANPNARAQYGRLGAASAFRRLTPQNAYADGSAFCSRLNYELSAQGGLMPLLGKLHQKFFGQSITSEQFREFINAETGRNFDHLFREFVY